MDWAFFDGKRKGGGLLRRPESKLLEPLPLPRLRRKGLLGDDEEPNRDGRRMGCYRPSGFGKKERPRPGVGEVHPRSLPAGGVALLAERIRVPTHPAFSRGSIRPASMYS